MRPLILGSSSPYRNALLRQLQLDFTTDSPDIDETPAAGEDALTYVTRLACDKARAVGARHDDALVIGCDQCADLDGEIIGKPGDHAAATAQLHRLSGERVIFRTGICLLDTADGTERTAHAAPEVTFRTLTADEIEDYLVHDTPYNCTASFRSESRGQTLVAHIICDEPSAMIGLPLTKLTTLLHAAGVDVPVPH